VITVAIGWFVNDQLHDSLLKKNISSLKDNIYFISPFGENALEQGQHEQRQNLVRTLGNQTQTRITLFDKNGEIIADSEVSPEGMDPSKNRPELLDAMSSSFGVRSRMSNTLKISMLYVAKAVKKDNDVVGTIRLAIPMKQIADQIKSMQYVLIFISLVGVLSALFVGFVLARRVTIPITEMMGVCQAMNEGRYDEKVHTLPSDEIGLLGETLNNLGEQITKQISRLSTERIQLKTILAGMLEGIISVDNNDRVLFCNSGAYRLLNSKLEDCRGMKLEDAFGFQELNDVVKQARQQKDLVETEIAFHSEQKKTILEVHASSFRGENLSGVIIVLHDVTKVTNLERIRRDFVANVSHEIRTPLTSIKGYTETLLDGAIEDRENNTRFITKINDNANRLLILVQDLLNLAKIEAHEGFLRTVTTDWQPVVQQVLSQLEDEAKKKNLTIDLSQCQSLQVLGDRNAMMQIADNLITNAFRYSPEGSLITLITRLDGPMGVLEVKDNGMGIPQKDLERIFERFYRVDKARSRVLGGTGLGLSIVKHLVSNMRGKITVESTEGKGSSFFIHLPLPK
jgi:two-component system phosphate regulon sensor histidine kinase PhoR